MRRGGYNGSPDDFNGAARSARRIGFENLGCRSKIAENGLQVRARGPQPPGARAASSVSHSSVKVVGVIEIVGGVAITL